MFSGVNINCRRNLFNFISPIVDFKKHRIKKKKENMMEIDKNMKYSLLFREYVVVMVYYSTLLFKELFNIYS
jgi:hypothetical protein